MKSYTYSGAIKDKNIREILDIVLSGKKLEYTIDKEFITITTKGPSKQAKVYTVNGVVLSADDGEPLIGATVMVKGTSTGVLTDIDGKFTLPNVSSRSKLEFSYVGMLPQSLSPSPTMKVTLQSDVQTLSEVVVTGMQRMDKRMFTGATDQLKAENIKWMVWQISVAVWKDVRQVYLCKMYLVLSVRRLRFVCVVQLPFTEVPSRCGW